jgi:WD repeat-containing protein 45
MLFRTNILALVGGGITPRFPPTKVMIWDDSQGRAIGELAFRTSVRAVRLRQDRIAVALEHKVLLYNFEDLKQMHVVETISNTAGLLQLSAAPENAIVACPGLSEGVVRVDQLDTRRQVFINAHNSPLACLSLSSDGKLLATASTRGTIIRIFSTLDGFKVRELRRGSDAAKIYSIAFSHERPTPEWVAATSDRGTLHIFSMSGQGDSLGSSPGKKPPVDDPPLGMALPGGSPQKNNRLTAGISKMTAYLPEGMGGNYFASERSHSQFRLPDSTYSVVGFGKTSSTVIVITASGAYFRLAFDPQTPGQCEQLKFAQFMEDRKG